MSLGPLLTWAKVESIVVNVYGFVNTLKCCDQAEKGGL